MGRNRKNQSSAVRFGPALKAMILCLLIGASGVGYVWQKNQIHELGQQIKKREVQLKSLRTLNKDLQDQVEHLRSHKMLEVRVKQLNLGLAQPDPSKIWRLPAPSPAVRTGEENSEFAPAIDSPVPVKKGLAVLP